MIVTIDQDNHCLFSKNDFISCLNVDADKKNRTRTGESVMPGPCFPCHIFCRLKTSSFCLLVLVCVSGVGAQPTVG